MKRRTYTALCALLGRHPEVFVHPRKELNFFSFDENYAKGIEHYRAFRDFSQRGGVFGIAESAGIR